MTNKEMSIKAVKILYHTGEITVPILIVLLNPLMSSALLATALAFDGKCQLLVCSLIGLNTMAHGCHGLYKELKPIMKENHP